MLGPGNLCSFSSYYAFEQPPKFSVLCSSKEPIMPHIDVINNLFSAVVTTLVVLYISIQQGPIIKD